MAALASATSLRAALEVALGAENVIADDSAREFAANDVYARGEPPALVLRPTTIESLAAGVRISTEAGYAIVARGGGASYTDGYLPINDSTVSIDMRSLDRVVRIDEQNGTVTVEAGCTWAALHGALAEHGLRTPFFGPFSGLAASIGGSLSQHAVSHGSGRYGVSADSVLSMDVVLASGDLLSTGSAALQSADQSKRRFFRHNGPDLTGLFCGDAGTLGVKATVTLPLLHEPAATAGLSFNFPTFDAMHQGMRAVASLSADDENFGLDVALQQGQIARNEATAIRLQLAWQIFKSAPNWLQGLRSVLQVAIAGDKHLREPNYAVSYIVKGQNNGVARYKCAAIREAVRPYGKEVPNTIPKVVASMPFAPLHNILGPGGERWVPIHGILQHSDVEAFHRRYLALLERYRSQCDELEVWTGAMFQTIGTTAFLYEIAFYWPDALSPYHQQTLDKAFLDTVALHPPNPRAAALVAEIKAAAVDLFSEFGAVHLQIGKAYPFVARLEQPASALLHTIKHSVDPNCLMNPGGLGISF